MPARRRPARRWFPSGLLLLLAGWLFPASLYAQRIETPLYVSTAQDIALGEMLLDELAGADARDGGDLMVLAARRLLGQEYVAGTQEGREERLRIFLTRTDCILYAETCLALTRTVQRCGRDATFEDLAQSLRASRYRDGVVDGYPSRLHYTTEWIVQGVREGLFNDITGELGGVPDRRRICFMTSHPDSYAPLKGESEYARGNRERIARIEEAVSAMPRLYVPKADLPGVEEQIRNGDLLCFATSIDGLDYSHVVIAWREKPDGPLGFIHASSAAGKVIVEPRSLQAYLAANRRITGVTVLREP